MVKSGLKIVINWLKILCNNFSITYVDLDYMLAD